MGNRLLLADDSITIQKVVGIIFADEEFELTVVDNGDAALEKARAMDPDVMLVDALMPGKSGYEVCQEARRDPVLKDTPILLLVGAFEAYDEEKGRDCGADETITKPFESQQLIDRVKALMEMGRARRAAAAARPAPVEPPSLPEAAPAQPEAALVELDQEILDATLEDDLWGAFETETPAPPAAPVGEDQTETFAVEEIFTFEDESEAIEETGPPLEQDSFALAAGDAFSFEPEEGELEPPIVEFAAEPVTAAVDADVYGAGEAGILEREIPEPVQAPAATVTISEEQLAEAIARISREVIERVVWEVVPDLAEALIKEEIRKLKSGTPG